jgi:membrane-bound serine protease (ClpP class)
VINDPNIALALAALGILGIYAEFCSPGLILPGVLGATLALLAASSLLANPIDLRGASLMAIAFLAFGLEAFLSRASARLHTHGILTAAGAVALLLGSLLLVDSPDPARRIHPMVAAAVAIPFAPLTSFLFIAALRARRNKQTDILKCTDLKYREMNSQS